MNKESQSKIYWHHFIAGLVGGFISVTVCHPLEVARSRLNLQNATKSVNKYQGFINSLYVIYKEEGFAGYYKGYRATAIANPIFHSLFFPLYKWNKKTLEISYGISGFQNHLLATIITGLVCDLITNPLWLIRTRMQTQYLHDQNNAKYTSVFRGLITLQKEEGFLALYKGLGATVLGLSHVAVQFPIYERLKQNYTDKNGQLLPTDILKASILSKSMAVLVTYPHVVIRTRLHDNKTVYKSGLRSRVRIIDICRVIYEQDSIGGFYKGLIPDLIRVLPTNSITFLVYELFSQYLGKHF
ncbi:unnamed protein product (macronuclear) [Paramecium tetraurelia]|uniref:Mitochondrial carrier protein n=1 Tax=Paramecium tetraurelia TaxID=5888 RepID=A0CYL2_PARTE|nr:uncharacterized protein GSPATT00011480001 [Paramecium tetraurelia]CAK75879.1 unnamed protein product [Paramecium tetraurelia]|eukprot:XP_001443276.1 hypothetical protein (macronuclear) [Paramecium tetraurelia strain d4-2]